MKRAISTDHAPSAIGPYSQAIRAGNLLFVSGQIPLDPVTGTVLQGDAAQQVDLVMRNLSAILEAAGTDMAHVVKTTIFLRDLADFAEVNDVYASYLTPPFPARATVQVARLPRDVSVEIDAIAVID